MSSKKLVAIVTALFMLVGLTACNTATTTATTQPTQKPTATTSSTTAATTAATTATTATTAKPDPFGKYDPEITITSVYTYYEGTADTIGPNDTFADNVWTKLAKSQLGINIVYNWIIADTQAEQKMNVSIASNDLPDIIPVNVAQLGMLMDSGSVVDLAPLIAQYASPDLQDTFTMNKTMVLNAGVQNDKVWAIPRYACLAYLLNAEMLFVRKDWLTKLSLPEPKTMQDVLAISTAFTKNDPDGNNKADTIGLCINKTLSSVDFTNASGFFEGYHAYPYNWMKDAATGQLTYGAVQSQVRDALIALQTMYKAGELDQEFGVKDGAAASEAIVSGKCGMQYGLAWNFMWPLNGSNQNDPNADWTSYPLPSIDSNPALPIMPLGDSTYFAVNKNCAHPEAWIKLLNQYQDKVYHDGAHYDETPEGYMLFKLELADFELLRFDDERRWYNSVHEAFASNDTSKLIDSKATEVYNKIVAYKKGDTTGNWEYFKFYDYDIGSVKIDLNYLDNNQMLYDQFFGAPTPTMSEKWQTLQKMEDEVFTNIIIGADISTYDKFVSDWKSLGGDQITQEVNEWYKTQAK
jgi:putative aldouronate transport system substrate-binding protein